MRTLTLSLATASLLFSGCLLLAEEGGEAPPTVGTPTTEASTLPLLTDPFTLGTTLYASADLSSLTPAVRGLLQQAIQAGLGGFTYYVDWADLEPQPGQYTLDELTERLDTLQALGLRPFVNLTVGDSETYNLPDGLAAPEGGLADGLSLDDDEVVERFGRLLDRLVPILLERGVFALGVGNEVDGYLDDNRRERNAYTRFVEAARDRVHAQAPELAVAVSLTGGAVRGRTPTYRALRPVADIIPFNYAPIPPDFIVLDLDDVQEDFQEVIEAYGEGPIFIQELTCPSPASMGASEAWQQGCFEILYAELAVTPQVRYASVFTLQDFEEATCDLVRDALFGDELDELPREIAQRLADYLCFLGIVGPDGTPKPAWDLFVDAAGGLPGDTR